MTFPLTNLAGALESGGSIAPEDVLAARRWAWGDGAVSPAEAEAIFEINHLAKDPPAEWVDFFVEAMVEYVVNRQPPRGYVDEANAAWLMARIDHDGRVDTAAELELLVRVLETSLNVPQTLKAYALRQIEIVVLTGEGPTRRGGTIRPGVIDEAEVTLLRRLIFAAGGEGALVVSRDEAEMLWRLKDATLGADNAPGWRDLFVQAVANHLMAYSSYRPLERDEAARLDAFIGDTSSNVGRFMGRMFRSSPAEGFRRTFGKKAPEVDHAGAAAAAQAVTAGESAWLSERTDGDGRIDPLEEALLAFIAEEGAAAR